MADFEGDISKAVFELERFDSQAGTQGLANDCSAIRLGDVRFNTSYSLAVVFSNVFGNPFVC